jgi:hypothetical protein
MNLQVFVHRSPRLQVASTGGAQHGCTQRALNWDAMGTKPFDFTKTILDLLNRIEGGRKIVSETQHIHDNFQAVAANRNKSIQCVNELHVKMGTPDKVARREAEAELELQVAEHRKLVDQADELWRQLTEANGFLGPFIDDVHLLLQRLPLKPEWDAYRQAIKNINVRGRGSWVDPPGSPALDTLEMRLREMLDLARGAQTRQTHREATRAGEVADLSLR